MAHVFGRGSNKGTLKHVCFFCTEIRKLTKSAQKSILHVDTAFQVDLYREIRFSRLT